MESLLLDRPYQNKLARLARQMELTEQTLSRHPDTADKLSILQILLQSFRRETKWRSAGPTDRLLMTLELAFLGTNTETSETGFFGPVLTKTQYGAAKLMQTLSAFPSEGTYGLLLTTVQLMNSVILYLVLQVFGKWKDIFPLDDPAAAKRGAALYQELGVIFLTQSNLISSFFKRMAIELGWNEKAQKIIGDIGLLQTLLLVFVASEHNSDLQHTLLRSMKPLLNSVDFTIQLAQTHEILDEAHAFSALSYLQSIQLATEDLNVDAFKQSLENYFDSQELSYKNLKDDLKKVEIFCSQLESNFKQVFNQTSQATSSLSQSA